MSVSLSVISDIAALEALAPLWDELARAGGDGSFFRGPGWMLPWIMRFIGPLEATPQVAVIRDGETLIGLAPFYERTARFGPGVKVRELRLCGDAGPRPPALDLLVRPGSEARVAAAWTEWLCGAHAASWDVLDAAPLRDPSRARAFLVEKLDASGRKVESEETLPTLAIALASDLVRADGLAITDDRITVITEPGAALEKGLASLRRLSRLEWADRDEASPIANAEATALLHDVALAPGARARLARLDALGEAVACALIVDDPPRAVCVALAVDPEVPNAGGRLLTAEARAAAGRGLRALDLVVGPGEIEPPPLPTTRRRSLRLRAYNNTAAGTLARTYASLRRRAGVAFEAPGAAAAGARAAWTKIREAAATVASVERLHLYRGELWTRGVKAPEGLTMTPMMLPDFEALGAAERASILERLELEEAYCRDKWGRGDLSVVARLGERPVGIAWSAFSSVPVPEIAREVRPGHYECYIHDVFVAHDARGRNVAPVMLEDLARRLRARDVYRAWALIEPSNIASTRAFEKAAYVAVADVVVARVGGTTRLVLRPPDPEGKRLLGIP